MVILESVFFIGICGAQVYYIQNLLENKRLIWAHVEKVIQVVWYGVFN